MEELREFCTCVFVFGESRVLALVEGFEDAVFCRKFLEKLMREKIE
jgi:hypothetical protein